MGNLNLPASVLRIGHFVSLARNQVQLCKFCFLSGGTSLLTLNFFLPP